MTTEVAVCQNCIIGVMDCAVCGKNGHIDVDVFKCRHQESIAIDEGSQASKTGQSQCSSFIHKQCAADAEKLVCPSHECHKCKKAFDHPAERPIGYTRCIKCPKAFHYDEEVEHEQRHNSIVSRVQSERLKVIHLLEEEVKKLRDEFIKSRNGGKMPDSKPEEDKASEMDGKATDKDEEEKKAPESDALKPQTDKDLDSSESMEDDDCSNS